MVSLIVALVMSVTAWRLVRDEKRRSAARIAALSAAASDATRNDFPERATVERRIVDQPIRPAAPRVPWKPAPFDSTVSAAPVADPMPLRMDSPGNGESSLHAAGFLGASPIESGNSNRQRGLAIATVVFFITITGGFLYMMSGSDSAPATAAAAAEAPLELVSLSHARQTNNKLAVSGLVRNPVAGKPVEKLSAVVFLFDRTGTFVTSSRANVDFLKLGAGDESPFVVSIDAPASVARYRVSFRTDDGVMPHIDRRGESPAVAEGQPLNISAK